MESKTELSLPISARVLIQLLLGITVIFILIVAKTLLVPLFFATLFAYALYPSAEKLEKAGIPRIVANFILIFSLIGVAALGIYGVTQLSATFTDNLPSIKENVEQNISAAEETVRGWINISDEQVQSFTESIQNTGQIIGSVFSSTTNTILAIGLLPVYTFLLLFYRNKFRNLFRNCHQLKTKK
jgi:predicted PurR-regulated permease PerM